MGSQPRAEMRPGAPSNQIRPSEAHEDGDIDTASRTGLSWTYPDTSDG